MDSFQETNLWKRAFSPCDEESPAAAGSRARLKDACLLMRERAIPIAERIGADLPEYTVHDVSHLDALWEIADLIVGPGYAVTPIETFILGAAFLLHDLGLGLAAFPNGLSAIKQETIWQDQVALKLRAKLGRPPSLAEIEQADQDILSVATKNTLRLLH